MSQRRATTEQLLAIDELNRRQADLAVRHGLPPPRCLGANLSERLDPEGKHVLTYTAALDACKATVLSEGAGRPRFRTVHALLKLLGDDEPYAARLDVTKDDFDRLPDWTGLLYVVTPATADYRRKKVRAGQSPPGHVGGKLTLKIRGDKVLPRKKRPAVRPENADRDRMDLTFAVTTHQAHRAECVACGTREEAEDIGLANFVRSIHADGWRVLTSAKLKARGAVCPDCVRKPDNERGV